MHAPVLLTERLRLDGHRVSDLDALAAMWQQREVYALIGTGRPRSRGEVWAALTGAVGQWTLFGHGGWTVRDRASGAVLGSVGFAQAMRDLVPPLDAPEAGWVLTRAAQGRGLGGEALAAIHGWADGQGIARTVCIIDPANAGSIALARRIGYRPLGERAFLDGVVAVFARTGPDGGAAIDPAAAGA